jgi:hypothetical protein
VSLLPTLIGLIGYKRAGKNAVADVLVEEYGYRAIAFADPLRDAAYALNPIVGANSFGDLIRYRTVMDLHGYESAKDLYPEVRAILQRLGTDAIRALDDGFWLRAGTQRIDATLSGAADRAEGKFDATGSSVVVTDCRFPNEADAIRQRGGMIVRVVRPGYEPGPDAHESETALDGYQADLQINNDGTLDDLTLRTRRIATLAECFVGRSNS